VLVPVLMVVVVGICRHSVHVASGVKSFSTVEKGVRKV
jgi:hypothetical protein